MLDITMTKVRNIFQMSEQNGHSEENPTDQMDTGNVNTQQNATQNQNGNNAQPAATNQNNSANRDNSSNGQNIAVVQGSNTRQRNPLNREDRNKEHFLGAFKILQRWLYSDDFAYAEKSVREKRTIHFVKSCLPYLHTRSMHDQIADATSVLLNEHRGRERLVNAVDRHIELYWDFNETLPRALQPFDVFEDEDRNSPMRRRNANGASGTSTPRQAQATNVQMRQNQMAQATSASQAVAQENTAQATYYANNTAMATNVVQENTAQATYYANNAVTATNAVIAQQNPTANATNYAQYQATYATATPYYQNQTGQASATYQQPTVIESNNAFTLMSNRTLYIGNNVPQEVIETALAILRLSR